MSDFILLSYQHYLYINLTPLSHTDLNTQMSDLFLLWKLSVVIKVASQRCRGMQAGKVSSRSAYSFGRADISI